MEGQTVYSSFNCLDEVFLFREREHEFLYNIITKMSDVMVDMGGDEFENIIKENPFIKSLLKRPHKKIYPLKQFFDNIENENLSSFPRDIFLLDKPKGYCDSKKEKYGVLVLSAENLSEVEVLGKRKYKSYTKGESTDEAEINGWKSFLDSFKLKPINSLVIIDNHIFNNTKSGKNNLINLIGSILPQNLEISFQVLIVIENRDAKITSERLEIIKNEIQAELGKNVDYEIDVGIITHPLNDEFHNRVLISNYHILKTPYGFDCFDDEGKVKKSNDPEILSAYYTLRNKEGDPEIKLICKKLKQVKNLVAQNESSNPDNKISLLVGNASNRLLSDF